MQRPWLKLAAVLFAVGWGTNHFGALLIVYRHHLGLGPAAPAALFGMYALGLVPGLLLAGPLSDRLGRRALVLPASAVTLVASAALAFAQDSFYGLLAGRLVFGLAAGAAMSPGSAWMLELSADAPPGTGARRATIALSAGFGLGPLASGALAQWAPAPMVLPYVGHGIVGLAALAIGFAIPAGRAPVHVATLARRPLVRISLDGPSWRRFLRRVVPMAPWVFGFPAIAFVSLPQLAGPGLGGTPLFAGVLAAITLWTGVLLQPLTRRFSPDAGARLGLAIGCAGILVGAVAVGAPVPQLCIVAAALLGGGYGVCMTSGLRTVEGLAPPETRGGLTGLYYVLTYTGFAAPFILSLVVGSSAVLALVITAGLAALVAATLPSR
ncbi:MAG TPA: MFS transporter [Kofleriaceae bacterium]|jgi:MFS family permease